MNTKVGLIGKKMGMGHIYDEEGRRFAVTLVYSPDCIVTDVRTSERDGYSALQLGVGNRKAKRTSKPLAAQFRPLGKRLPHVVSEFRLPEPICQQYKVGDPVTVSIFQKGQFVDVRGTTIGKGFQGVVRRHKFAGFSSSRGTHESFRGPGAIGQRTWPARVRKGLRMAGQMGNVTCTKMNLRIMDVKPDEHVLIIKGSIPGPKNQWIEIRLANKKPTSS